MSEIGEERLGEKWPGATPETAVRIESPVFRKTDIWKLEGKGGGEISVEGDFVVYTDKKLRKRGERRKLRVLEETGKGEKELYPEAGDVPDVLSFHPLSLWESTGIEVEDDRFSWKGFRFVGSMTESDPKKVTRKKGRMIHPRWEIETKPTLQIDGQGLFILHEKILECVQKQFELGLVAQEDYERFREFVEEGRQFKERREREFKERSKKKAVVERPLTLSERLERQINASPESVVKLSLSKEDIEEFVRSIPLPGGANWLNLKSSFENGWFNLSGTVGKLFLGVDFESKFWVDPERGVQAKLLNISNPSYRQRVEEYLQNLDNNLGSFLEKELGIKLKRIGIGEDNLVLEVEKTR